MNDRGVLSRTVHNQHMKVNKLGGLLPWQPKADSSGSMSPGPRPESPNNEAVAALLEQRGRREAESSHPCPSDKRHARKTESQLRFRDMLRPQVGKVKEVKWSHIEKLLWNAARSTVSRFPAVARVRRIVDSLQTELNLVSDQASLADLQMSLKVDGVIYAIVCCTTRRVYVGQTIKSALARFREHWNRAKHGATEPLHVALRKFGAQNFVIVPLEVLPRSEYAHVRPTKKDKFRKVRAFHKVASPRELFWIDRLRSFSPVGFNVSHSVRKCRRRKRVSNPMKRHRQLAKAAQIEAAVDEADDGMDHKHSDVAESKPSRAKAAGSKPAPRWYGSRDWERRLKYLAERIAQNTWQLVNFDKYAPRTLHCMLGFLEAGECKLPADVTEEISRALNSAIKLRMPLSRKANSSKPFIRIIYTAHGLQSLPLKSFLLDRKIWSIFPIPDENFREYVICKRLVEPIGREILNYRRIAHRMADDVVDTCPCRQQFHAKFRPNAECVLTGDLSLVRNKTLKQLIANGPNFRDFSETHPMDAIRSGLSDFISWHSEKHAISRSQYAEWRHAILQKCKAYLPIDDRSKHIATLQTPAVAKYLRFLQRYLVLVPVDKAAGNVAFVCKRLYTVKLANELSRVDGAYEPETQTPDEILDLHRDFLQPIHLFGQRKLPYLYWTPKFHKEPVGQRFIAGSSKCSTTTLSKLLSNVLTLVMRTLRNKDDEHIRRTGIRRYFTVETFDEVSQFLSKWIRIDKRQKIYTGDFSTMYTTIPHTDLIKAVHTACTEAFGWHAKQNEISLSHVRIGWSKSGAAWKISKRAGCTHSKTEHTLDVDAIVHFVSFLVSNTFLVNGYAIRRQKLGIPMGTNCAPVLANLYLYVYESSLVDKLKATAPDRARRFHLTFRYIDDVLSIDNQYWLHAVEHSADNGGLYPVELKLSDTSVADDEAHFLGMHIKAVGNKLRVSVFDKRNTFPFEVMRYPHMASLIPSTIPFGVFVGQLYRGYRICSEFHDFTSYSLAVAHRLLANGCSRRRLASKYRAFVRTRVRKYNVRAHTLVKQFEDELGN